MGYRSTCCALGVAGDARADVAAFTSAPSDRGLVIDSERADLVELLGAHTRGRNARNLALGIRAVESQNSSRKSPKLFEASRTIHELAELRKFESSPHSRRKREKCSAGRERKAVALLQRWAISFAPLEHELASALSSRSIHCFAKATAPGLFSRRR